MCVKIKPRPLRFAGGIDRLPQDGMADHRHYILFHKPYGVLSRFTPEAGWESLKSFGPFPPRVYPVGRLDVDSEGLLLLTDDNEVKHRLTTPRFRHPRTYLVQVERIPSEDTLQRLRSGILLDGTATREAGVRRLEAEPRLGPRAVPIRIRKNVETCWLEMVLKEGRNRQVRRMTAAAGHPALRLVRTGIGPLHLAGLRPGHSRELSGEEISKLRSSLRLRPG
jgi:23S rRNA pseudouridine2457 synthase